jgi:hypothetical protein
MAALGRVFVGPPSGYVVEAVGWVSFFFITFLAALPGLWLLWRLRDYFTTGRSQTLKDDAQLQSEPA